MPRSVAQVRHEARLSASEKNDVVKAAYRQVFERDITRAYSLGYLTWNLR
jgi:hypothetical protein